MTDGRPRIPRVAATVVRSSNASSRGRPPTNRVHPCTDFLSVPGQPPGVAASEVTTFNAVSRESAAVIVFGIGSAPDALYLSQRRRGQMRSLQKGIKTS